MEDRADQTTESSSSLGDEDVECTEEAEAILVELMEKNRQQGKRLRMHYYSKLTAMASRATLDLAASINNFPHGPPPKGGRCALSPWVGFDMDHTLLRYRRPEFDNLVYTSMATRLVKKHGYPKGLLAVPANVGTMQRGLVIDMKYGMVLKLDWACHVAHVQLNTYRSLRREEIVSVYGEAPVNLSEEERWMVLTTGFETPMAILLLRFAVLRPSLHKDAEALRRFFSHTHEAFSMAFGGDSTTGFLRALRDNPQQYIVRRSPALIQWLRSLRAGPGQCSFIVTNASVDFMNLVMPAAFGCDWRYLFDAIVVSAHKPAFFDSADHRRSALIEAGDEELPNGAPRVYQGGTCHELVQYLRGRCGGNQPPQVSYVGDHLLTDVGAAKTKAGWSTVAVVEELEEQGDEQPSHGAQFSTPHAGYLITPQGQPSYWARVIHESADITVSDVEQLCCVSQQ